MRTLIDPRFDCGNLLAGELAVHRHGRPFEARDAPIKPAFLRYARHNRRAFFAALQRTLERTQVELRKLHGLAMAFPAAILQNRLNVLREGDRFLRTRQRAGQGDHSADHHQSANHRGDNCSLGQVPSSRRAKSKSRYRMILIPGAAR